MRTIGILLLLVGLGVIGYGIWLYNEAGHAFEFDAARAVVEGGGTPYPVWIGGAMVLAGGIAMIATRNK